MHRWVDVVENWLAGFQSGPRRIRSLSAEEAANYASRIFKRAGRTLLSARFIYRALQLDSRQPQALLSLSDYFRTGLSAEKSSEMGVYSAIALERARSSVRQAGKVFRDLETSYLRLLWELKMAIPVKNPTALPADFNDPAEFKIDELAYVQMLGTETQRLGSADKAFEFIHTLIGLRAGFLQIKKPLFGPPKQRPSHEPPVYELTSAFKEWLRSDLRQVASY